MTESSKASEASVHKNNPSRILDYDVVYIEVAGGVPHPRYIKFIMIVMHLARQQSVFKAPYLIGGTKPKAIIGRTKPHASMQRPFEYRDSPVLFSSKQKNFSRLIGRECQADFFTGKPITEIT
jgi:hypothetical protein